VYGLEELVVKVDRTALPDVPRLRSPMITSSHDNGPTGLYARTLAKITGQATRTNRPVLADERTLRELIAVLAAGDATVPATAHRAAARSYIQKRLTDQSLVAPNKSRRRSGSVSGNCSGSSRPTHFCSAPHPVRPPAPRLLDAVQQRGRPRSRGRGQRRCTVRFYVGNVLLPHLPPALRPPSQRHPR
jgi:hypothetical protein